MKKRRTNLTVVKKAPPSAEPEPFDDMVSRLERMMPNESMEERLQRLQKIWMTAAEQGLVIPYVRELAACINLVLRIETTLLNIKRGTDERDAEAGSAVRKYASEFSAAAGQEREFHPGVERRPAGDEPDRDDTGYPFDDSDTDADADPAPDSA